MIALIALFTAASAHAQPTSYQFSDYVQAATHAKDQGKTLLVYFYSSQLKQPSQLRAWLSDETVATAMNERFIVVGLDLDSETGGALAEAFYSRSRLADSAQSQAAVVVEQSVRWRGVSFLGSWPGEIEASVWSKFLTNTAGAGGI